jgi:hypothetical protein
MNTSKNMLKLVLYCLLSIGLGFVAISGVKSVKGYVSGGFLILFGFVGICAITYRTIQKRVDPKAYEAWDEKAAAVQDVLATNDTDLKRIYDNRQIAQAQRAQIVAGYAAAQGWTQISADDATLGQYVPSVLRDQNQTGHMYASAYEFTLNASPARVFQYTYYAPVLEVNAHGSSSGRHLSPEYYQSPESYYIIAAIIPKPLAPLYVEKYGMFSQHIGYEHQENLSLEGDFSKFFSVYIPKGQELEALQLLQPDVMQYMLNGGQDFQFQTNGTSLLFMTQDNFVNPPQVSQLVAYAEGFIKDTDLVSN